MELYVESFLSILKNSGFVALASQWQSFVMILISFVLFYYAIVKKFEPLLLLPIAFGMFLANLPLSGLMMSAEESPTHVGGLLYYLYQGVKLGIYP